MADLNFTVDVRTLQAQANLKKVADQAKSTADSFRGLNTAIAGIAITGFIGSALRMADTIQEVGKASGLGTQFVKGFADAVVQSGGDFENAVTGIARFSQSISDALSGNDTILGKFEQLGISLNDLKTLSDQEILRKTIEGLARMPEGATKTALAMDLLSKKFATVDFKGLNNDLDSFVSKAGSSVSVLDESARLNDKLAGAVNNLQVGLLKAIEPLITFLGNLKSEQIERFVEAVVKIGVALTAIAGATKVFNIIAAGFASVAGAALLFKKGLGDIAGTIPRIVTQWGGFQKALALASGLFSKLYEVGKFVLIFLEKRVVALVLGFARLTPLLAIITGALYIINEAIALAFGVDLIDKFTGALGRSYDKLKEFFKGDTGQKKVLEDAAKAQEAADQKRIESTAKLAAIQAKAFIAEKTAQEEAAKLRNAINDAYAKEEQAVSKQIAGFQDANAEQVKALKTQIEMTSLSEKQQAVRSAEIDLEKRYGQETQDMLNKEIELNSTIADAKRRIAKEEEIAKIYGRETNKEIIKGLQQQISVAEAQLPLVKKGIRAVTEEYQNQVPVIKDVAAAAYDAAVTQRESQILLRGSLDQQIAQQNTIIDLQKQMAQLTMSDIEKKYSDIDAAARASAQAQIDYINTERALRKEALLDEQEKLKIYDQALEKTKKIKDAQKDLYDESRKFSTGWTKAMKDYVEAATDGAKRAEAVFTTATRNMEEAIVNFAKTGKFEFKSFVSSIVEELLRQQVRELIAKTFGGLSSPASGGGGGGGGLLGAIGGLLGFANGGIIPTNGPVLVGERGPELLMGAAGRNVIPNNQLGGQTTVVYNINAVDAMSFKQMVARDPSFIYAVSQQGAKSIPSTRR
jgi:lambda family phage tail tape measure protein